MTGNAVGTPSKFDLSNHGLTNLNMAYWTLSSPALVERIVQRGEGILAHLGAVVVRTGHHTGRSPDDKFVVREPSTEEHIWWGKVNRPMSPEHFDRLHRRMSAYFQGRDIYVQDVVAGAHPEHRMPVRIVSEYAWHSLFARNLFLRVAPEKLKDHVPEFTILDAPRFHAIPEEDGTNSEVFIVLNFAERLVMIGGTSYAGEIKKSIFTILNYMLPRKGILSMHCSANVGAQGDVALFFGLSGTGKTTLSSDPDRRLIGDDEHGWADDGIFNFEGGCYAKTVRLRAELEPIIWKATRSFGAVLENVTVDSVSRRVNFDDESLTENTRAAYSLGAVSDVVEDGRGGHPKNLFFLSADATGVLPPIARLNADQAMYYFLSGYTSKLAGTERGLSAEPQATFSTCFGAPFLPLPPGVYARLLREKLGRHGAQVWLVNTGWTGGAYGTGKRIDLPHTRAIISAALRGELAKAPMRLDPHFGFEVPTACCGIPEEVLDPKGTWRDGAGYDRQASALAERFAENFQQFSGEVTAEVASAGPRG